MILKSGSIRFLHPYSVWPPDEKSQFIGKDPDAGKDWRQKKKGVIKDEMVR